MKNVTAIAAVVATAILFVNCDETVHHRLASTASHSVSGGVTPTQLAQMNSSPGGQIFAQRCAGCHGSLAALGPHTVQQIQTAFGSVPAMSGVASITTPTEIQAIADALNGVGGTGVAGAVPTAPLTGEQLYKINCQGCHGMTPPDKATSANGITRAIGDRAPMAGLKRLSPSELQAISNYIRANLKTVDN